MATVKEVVLKHHKKEDGTWNVKIRITHGTKSAYINTAHFVTAKQLKKDFTIKDTFITDLLAGEISSYRRQISALGSRVNVMTAKDIASAISAPEESNNVDFGKFCLEHIEILKKEGKNKSAGNLKTVYLSLVDFFGTDKIDAKDINSQMLFKYEAYLKSDRTITRLNQFGRQVVIESKGVGSGLLNYMRDLRRMFNAARFKFNDEDTGRLMIPHYPFKKYKVGTAPATEKRNLKIEQLLLIKNCQPEPASRAEMARDLFMLSFYLCGMNAVDFFQQPKLTKKRVEYKRSKTKGKRKDDAFISINLPEIAIPLAKKYFGTLSVRYAAPDNLTSALNKGLKNVRDIVNQDVQDPDLKIDDLTFYHARHSFGTIARNNCRVSKDDIAMALNHVDQNLRVTDIYIAPDWSIIDEVQNAVISLLISSEQTQSCSAVV